MSPTVDHPLSARLFDRIPPLPPRLRSPAARRIVAAALVGLAVVSAYRTDPSRTEVPVVVTATDVAPGTSLTAADVTLTRVDLSLLADGTLRSVDDAVGRTVAGPVRSGEALTDVRLLGPRLASATLPSGDARIVPIRLADPELAQLLRAGDVVDVVRAAPDDTSPSGVIAESATVVMVSAPGSGVSRRDQLVLVALRADDASAVAAASLSDALTVLLR
ncbi:flagella basal body P-ring formation protein FlgA [Rhodococcus sp. BP-332]|uniref:SAF domain-containing protein n=1 Tax=Rhodococcus sp. BP-332 TaxID=2739447 RepID=UPI001C9AC060|nr:SAF domain-containing protein [Rhodococcus sp. BP-332]MBY6677557.1 flagella basal body P-ring formation protein FlgA [Rhodococcus sp. BP-332]